MKKLVRYFSLILVLLGASLLLFACQGVFDKPQNKLEAAFREIIEAYALDTTLTVHSVAKDANNRTIFNSTQESQFKVIDSEENRTAYTLDSNNPPHYFSQGIVASEAYHNVYDSDFTIFKLEYSHDWIISSVSRIIAQNTFSWSWNIDYSTYALYFEEATITSLTSKIYPQANVGELMLTILQDRNTKKIARIELFLFYYVGTESYNIEITLDINAINNDVSIEIPDNVKAQIDSYNRKLKINVITSPQDAGISYNNIRYSSGEIFNLYANWIDGFDFIGWYMDGVLVEESASFQDTMPERDITVEARYEPASLASLEYQIWTNAEPYSNGTTLAPSYVKAGQSVTIEALSNDGYVFTGWYEYDTLISKDSVFTFNMPGRNLSYKAKFSAFTENYTNTTYDAVKYFDISGYQDLIYDSQTNKFAVLRNNSVDIYDGNMTKEKTLNFSILPRTIDAHGGILAIGFGDVRRINLYDLTDNTEIKQISTITNVFKLFIDGETIIYANSNEWSYLTFYNQNNNTNVTISESTNTRTLTLNRDEHILYAAGYNTICLYNSKSGNLLASKYYHYLSESFDELLFDGKYIHIGHKVFDRLTADIHSINKLNRHYNELDDFTPLKTIYDTDDFAFVLGNDMKYPVVGVYDNFNEKYIYRFNFAAKSIQRINANKYLAKNFANNYVAIIDMNLAAGQIEGNKLPPDLQGEVTQNANGKMLKHFEDYTAQAADESYIYLINENTFRLTVYDIVTLDKVFSQKFMLKPVCLDAYGGKLAIGFSHSNKFFVYNTNNWSFVSVNARDAVEHIVVFEDKIIHMSKEYITAVNIYSLTRNEYVDHSTTIAGFTSAAFAVNHADAMLYIATNFQLIYLDLSDYTSNFQYFYTNQIKNLRFSFDENLVYYAGKSYDKTYLKLVSGSLITPAYRVEGYKYISSIYRYGNLSVLTAEEGTQIHTFIYDIETNQILSQFSYEAQKVIKTENGFILFHSNRYVEVVNV